MTGIQLFTYFAFLVAFIAIVRKVLRYATAPESMRWELYPVPHEKGRADYGGSYFEELDWWTKKRETDLFNELKEMFTEIVFLKGILHHNKKVWNSSFPFHFGLYLTMGWLALLMLGGILQISGMTVDSEGGIFSTAVYYMTIPLGYGGLVLAGLGSFGLLIWRMTDKVQKKFNAPIDFINLFVFSITAVVTVVAQYLYDPTFSFLRSYTASLLTFSSVTSPHVLLSAEIVLLSFLTILIPITKMSHFVAKYFLYHSVRWNDESNERGSKIEKNILEALNKQVGWSADHIRTGKTWGEVITEPNNEKE
ncbi:MAG: nitrate reductase [bacterium]|nr:nitrate reductase [bacterium]